MNSNHSLLLSLVHLLLLRVIAQPHREATWDNESSNPNKKTRPKSSRSEVIMSAASLASALLTTSALVFTGLTFRMQQDQHSEANEEKERGHASRVSWWATEDETGESLIGNIQNANTSPADVVFAESAQTFHTNTSGYPLPPEHEHKPSGMTFQILMPPCSRVEFPMIDPYSAWALVTRVRGSEHWLRSYELHEPTSAEIQIGNVKEGGGPYGHGKFLDYQVPSESISEYSHPDAPPFKKFTSYRIYGLQNTEPPKVTEENIQPCGL
ncbi:hypothetical protein ACWFMI_25035 [Nocardiopsis terrae]|uniref:hypothetical protein n=1 Tax=Streptomyces sp. NPDC057554 TaxID=3350538 RepID=UPI0036D0271B